MWIISRDIKSDYACNSLSDNKILRDNYNFTDFYTVLVEKGSCSFPKMAREVAKIGRDMVLIVNKEPGSVKYSDDGRGSEISIYYLTPKIEGLLQSQQMEDCLKDGLFCMNSNLNTKNNNLKKVKGIDLIYESLYNHCIYEKIKNSYFNIF